AAGAARLRLDAGRVPDRQGAVRRDPHYAHRLPPPAPAVLRIPHRARAGGRDLRRAAARRWEHRMKRTLTAILALALLALPACRKDASPPVHQHEAEKVADVYYCPMHPTVTSDKPGSCPICGMQLVKRVAAVQTSRTADVSLSHEQRVTANVRTQRVALGTHTGELVTTGRVTFDERRLAQVSAYTAGRIEKLFVNFTGDTVRSGEAVGTIYSPDLFATQQEYLLSLENRE